MPDEHPETEECLRRAAAGDADAAGRLFEACRERLARMVEVRLDRRLRGRVAPSDVVQETFLEAARRLEGYLQAPEMPFRLWVRFLAGQQILAHERRHLGAAARDVRHEERLTAPAADVTGLAEAMAASQTSPSSAAGKAEARVRLERALLALDPLDREVIVLRHFELLGNVETAEVLGLLPAAASKKYVRALDRLREALKAFGGGPPEVPS